MEILLNPETWVALLTLTALEIVLGIDNIVFISIVAGKLPENQRDRVRRIGLFAAMGMRIGLLLVLSWVIGLTAPLFEIAGHPFSGRDLILIVGGLFLLGKATFEIHGSLEGGDHERQPGRVSSFWGAIIQIMLLDIIFSLDSVITAVGLVDEIPVMIAAIVIAVLVMLVASSYIVRVLDEHPSLKMLALSFLVLIGATLVVEGFGQHIDKAYIYFAMGFAVLVELLNIRATRKPKPVHLRDPYTDRVSDKPGDDAAAASA